MVPLVPFQIDPSWYERYWLMERAQRRRPWLVMAGNIDCSRRCHRPQIGPQIGPEIRTRRWRSLAGKLAVDSENFMPETCFAAPDLAVVCSAKIARQ
jgi:hypothetical protein